jgi:hypothetical protein
MASKIIDVIRDSIHPSIHDDDDEIMARRKKKLLMRWCRERATKQKERTEQSRRAHFITALSPGCCGNMVTVQYVIAARSRRLYVQFL